MIPDLQHEPVTLQPPDAPALANLPVLTTLPPVEECGEPLVEVQPNERITILNLYAQQGWPGTSPTVWLRATVCEALQRAAQTLPTGFGLAIFDAWRSPTTVRALYEHFYGPGSTLPAGFLADPDDPAVVPPHTTGAAVDLTLTWQGRALALGTWFDDFSARAARCALEGDPTAEPSRSLRRLLHHHLGAQGFVGLASEWWHVSLGDQHWAAVTGATVAPFGAAQPG
jgi:D-alanyl-D-alanine dipeptidase